MKNDSMAKARGGGESYAERKNKISILTAIGGRVLERFPGCFRSPDPFKMYTRNHLIIFACQVSSRDGIYAAF